MFHRLTPRSDSRRTLSRLAIVGLAAAGLAIAGCNRGNGAWTAQGKSLSKQRVDQLKSANEYQMAQQNFLAGDLDKALKGIDRSLTINPSVPKSHVLRGRILIERNDLEGASTSLLKAEALDPENVEAQYYLGILAERVSDREEALKRYQTAARLDPSNPQYAVAAAECLMDLGRLDEAEQLLNGQKSTLSHNAGIRQTLGHIAMIKGDHEKAVELFNEARLLAPEDNAVIEDLVRAQISTSRFAEAEYNLARLVKSPGNEGRRDLKAMRAKCLVNVDRPLEAREILLDLTSGDAGAKDVEAWIELGQLSFVLKDMNRVKQAASRVIALAPGRSEGYTLRGLWYKRRGELTNALADFDRAVERRGTDTQPLVLRGLTLEGLGRFDDARQSYAAVLKQNPTDEGVSRLLDSLQSRQAVANAPEGNGN
jgi:Flp pilus assembly protein TadD